MALPPIAARRDVLAELVERLLSAVRAEPGLPFVVLIGHGLGGLLAAAYLETDFRQPDLAVLMSPELRGWEERPVAGRLRSLLFRAPPPSAPVTAAGVMQGLDRIRVPFRLDHGSGGDLRPDTGWIDALRAHPMTQPPWAYVTPMLGGDLANQPGLRDRVGIIGRWILGRAHEQFPDAVPPLPDGQEWARLSRREATAAFRAYVDSEADRLTRFVREVADRGGPEPAASRMGMARLGAWLLDVMEVGPQESGDLPDWARVHQYGTVRRLSEESLRLIDGAATHFAASLRTLDPTLEWQLCTQKIDAYYHRPVLEPIHLAPPVPVIGVLSQLVADEPAHDWLARTWDAWTDTIRALREAASSVDDPLPLDEVAVEDNDDPRWNARIWIPEGAETVIGSERFERLGEAVAHLEGVDALAWEDREVMLVRLAAGVRRDDLRGRVVQLLAEARRAAEADDAAAEES
jgi:hypothetical protein